MHSCTTFHVSLKLISGTPFELCCRLLQQQSLNNLDAVQLPGTFIADTITTRESILFSAKLDGRWVWVQELVF
jgi:hypothetical protein